MAEAGATATATGGVMAVLVVWKQDLEAIGRATATAVAEESLGLGKQDLMNQEKWRELELELSDAIGEEEVKHF